MTTYKTVLPIQLCELGGVGILSSEPHTPGVDESQNQNELKQYPYMIKTLMYGTQYQGIRVPGHILLKILSVLINRPMVPCLEIFWAHL